jgi:hypothetical protein
VTFTPPPVFQGDFPIYLIPARRNVWENPVLYKKMYFIIFANSARFHPKNP